MKVLLFGEFSSLHKYLYDGLQYVDGVDADFASNGDGWKSISGGNITIPSIKSSKIKDRFFFYKEFIKLVNQIKGYDVVQIINSSVIPPVIGVLFIRKLKRHNKYISLLACGNDYPVVKAYKKGLFDYHPFDGDKSIVKKYEGWSVRAIVYRHWGKKLEKFADIIIPSLYEYTLEYNKEKLYSVIPFPINVDAIKFLTNDIKDKLVIFHGISREGMKGTQIIREALKKIKELHNDVDVIIDGKMPFEEYQKVLKKSNIVIDQCRGYGYGINACISMAQGKVVISGRRKETLDSMGVKDCPLIEAKPDVEFLVNQIENLIINKNNICEMGYKSREYVCTLHDYKKVAKQYVEAWNTLE